MSVTNTHFGAEKISRMLSGRKAVYFLGIGGITMSSMAHITKTMGYRVGGSDRTLSPLTERLAKEGIEIFCGHDASHLDGYDALVYTVAVRDDTPELVRARAEGLPVISRADYLGYLMRGYTHRVGLAGMHGKSTTTSMTTEIFLAAGADPTVISGAELSSIDGAYRVGGRENFIFEACEYMDSFLDFYPTVAAVLNIEMDHVDYFKSMAQIKHSFRAYIDKTVGCGCAVLNADDDNVCDMAEGFGGSVLTFGIRRAADVTAKNITYDRGRASFDLCHGSMKKHVTLAVCGEHNVYNALAAAACAILCGIPSGAIVTGLGNFRGAKRRLEFKGKELLFAALLATMMIPGELFTITNYGTVTALGWKNTYTVLIVPFLVSVFYIYLLRQSFLQIPNELYLAAKVDGTKDWKYLWKVMVPLSLPTLISITILKMMGAWNSYIWPRLVANDEAHRLITNGLRNAFTETTGDVNYPVQMAAVALVSLPLFLVYLFLRKYIMKGVSRSGIKG